MKTRIHSAASDGGYFPRASSVVVNAAYTTHTGDMLKPATREKIAFNRRVELVLAEARRRGVRVADLEPAGPNGANIAAYLDTLEVFRVAEQTEMARSRR